MELTSGRSRVPQQHRVFQDLEGGSDWSTHGVMLLRAGLHGWSLQAGSDIVGGARPSAAQSVSGLEWADLGLCY